VREVDDKGWRRRSDCLGPLALFVFQALDQKLDQILDDCSQGLEKTSPVLGA
jgi:hypothetical protein